MPFDPALLAAGSDAAGSILNPIFTAITNKAQLKYNEKMYNRQRADALSDWDRQNQYNSPAAQMERFKAAGLNPALIYKQTNEAAPVRSAQVEGYNPKAPQVEPGAFGRIYGNVLDAQSKQAQTDNLREQMQLLMKEGQLKAAQTLLTLSQVDRNKVGVKKDQLDLDNAIQSQLSDLKLRRMTADKAEADVQFTYQQMKLNLSRNEREIAQSAVSIKEGLERILKSKRERILMDATEAKTRAEADRLYKEAYNLETQHQFIQNSVELQNLEKDLKAYELEQRKNGRNFDKENFVERPLYNLLEALKDPAWRENFMKNAEKIRKITTNTPN